MEEPQRLRETRRLHQHRPITADLQDEEEPQTARSMEGMLKKRLAKMPVMHDRYCVATWELDVRGRKCVIMRSYKSRKAYGIHPEKPSSVYEVKCISDWNGRTGFHRYKHAFTLETRDKRLYQCVAPSEFEKNKWVELMASQANLQSHRGMRTGNGGSLKPLRRSQSAVSQSHSSKPRAYSSASTGKTGHESTADAYLSTDVEDQVISSGHDGLFRTMSGASMNLLELPDGDKIEPADWGLCGDSSDEIKSKYEVPIDVKPVLLEEELLDTRGKTKTMASDNFLFEEAGISRFGAVVVKGANGSNDDDNEFIDESFAAREAHKKNDKKMKRHAQKIESNRDLYAEMAAARLADMRKDARHSKKSYNHSCPSADSDDSVMEENDDAQSTSVESEEIEDMNRHRSSQSRHSIKSQRKNVTSSSGNINRATSEDVRGDNEDEEEEGTEIVVNVPLVESESDELRHLRKRAERRAKRRLMNEKEEKDTAMAVAELARAYREEQRLREEAKTREELEKRSKKERRDMKMKLKREKAKQRQAEAQLQKVVKLKQAEEERRERERKERKERKKLKKKEKYTSPAERIHKKEERDAEHTVEFAVAAEVEAEVSNALVVVEKAEDQELAKQLPAAPTLTLKPPSLSVKTEAVQTTHADLAQVTAPTATSVFASTPALNTHGAAQSLPISQVVSPAFMPTYLNGPLSMPACGLAATFGAYPPFYTAPYSYGGPVGLQTLLPNAGFVAGLGAMGSFSKPTCPEFTPHSQTSSEAMIGPQLPDLEKRAAASSGVNAHSVSSPPAKLTNLPELPDVIEF